MASVDYIIEGVQSLQDTDTLLREVAFAMLPLTKNRIHVEGQRATGAPIGDYNTKYLKLRVMKYNRNADRDIIFSLTGAMENNYKVIAISDTEYGLGFDNPLDADKSVWLADRFGNDIWQLSESELTAMEAVIQQFVNNAFA